MKPLAIRNDVLVRVQGGAPGESPIYASLAELADAASIKLKLSSLSSLASISTLSTIRNDFAEMRVRLLPPMPIKNNLYRGSSKAERGNLDLMSGFKRCEYSSDDATYMIGRPPGYGGRSF